jgi:predicted cobalt transporter CbtA
LAIGSQRNRAGPSFRSSTVRHLRGKRDYAMVAALLGCGLRRAELPAAQVADLQQREEHWVFADLIGKGVTLEPFQYQTGSLKPSPSG